MAGTWLMFLPLSPFLWGGGGGRLCENCDHFNFTPTKIGPIPHHNKGHIWQTSGQHILKGQISFPRNWLLHYHFTFSLAVFIEWPLYNIYSFSWFWNIKISYSKWFLIQPSPHWRGEGTSLPFQLSHVSSLSFPTQLPGASPLRLLTVSPQACLALPQHGLQLQNCPRVLSLALGSQVSLLTETRLLPCIYLLLSTWLKNLISY